MHSRPPDHRPHLPPPNVRAAALGIQLRYKIKTFIKKGLQFQCTQREVAVLLNSNPSIWLEQEVIVLADPQFQLKRI